MTKLIDNYLPASKAAEQLGVSKPTLLKYCREKRIRFRKVGGRFWFTLDDLRLFIEANAVEPKAAPKPSRVTLKHLKG